MIKRLLAVLAAVSLLAACTDDGATPTSGPADTAEPTTTVPAETTTTTSLPEGTEELPEEVRVELAQLIAATEDARQLEFLEQPNIVVVSQEEFEARIQEQLEEDTEDIPADEALYDLLGLIGADTDLFQIYSDLYTGGVLGFYDGRIDELVVPSNADGFTVVQRATLIHELSHALTDQHFDHHARYVELLDNDRYDEAAAQLAVTEGDATLTELLYVQGLSAAEQAEFFAESFELADGADVDLESVPEFIRGSLYFPYEDGFLFVERLYSTGGFEAVEAVFADPPTSTEQILDPDDYGADLPIAVEISGDLALEGYELSYESTWGELGFALIFDQVIGADASDTAASGWGGDHYKLYFDGSEVVLVLTYRGDAASDADEMAAALRQYVETGMDTGGALDSNGGTIFQGEDNAWVSVDGSDVWFVAASTSDGLDAGIDLASANLTPDGSG